MENDIRSKMKHATKWSAITEVVAKLITPITSMVLARLLTPEAYGIVATISMIIIFAEIFTDAGFQKYIIQHNYFDEKEKNDSINVAFWSNLIMSLVFWGIISLFSIPLMRLVGNPGYEKSLIIACSSIPLSAFSSIQMAIYKREFEYKKLFKIRMIGTLVPLFITLPCAFFLRNYWALIIGNIFGNFINAIVLTKYSKWKPKFFYSWFLFKRMFSYTFWSMLEAISGWLVSYIDVFVIGSILSQYYLGLYKTASGLVSQVFALITATTANILFASLSRLQNEREERNKLFFQFQKYVAIFVIPLGFGFYCYKELFVSVTMGCQWKEATGLVGLWGLTSAFMIVLNHNCGILYRSIGKPKLTTISEWLHIVVLFPVVVIAAKHGFESLYISRSLIRLQHILVDLLLMQFVIHIPALSLLKNISHSVFAAIVMSTFAIYMHKYEMNVLMEFITIVVCVIIYFSVLLFFKDERIIISQSIEKIIKRKL